MRLEFMWRDLRASADVYIGSNSGDDPTYVEDFTFCCGELELPDWLCEEILDEHEEELIEKAIEHAG